MNFDIFNQTKARVYSPIVTDQEHEERECKTCKFGMPPLHRNEEESNFLLRERGIDYECDNCKTVNYVANSNSVTIAVATAIIICTIVGLIWAGGMLDYMTIAFRSSLIGTLISVIALGISAVALKFAWVRLKRGAELIEGRFQFPLVNRKPGINMLNLSLTMGLLPWLIAMALGYANQRYQILEGGMVLVMLPICLLPIALGRKVGSTKMNVFLATMFWFLLGGLIVLIMT